MKGGPCISQRCLKLMSFVFHSLRVGDGEGRQEEGKKISDFPLLKIPRGSDLTDSITSFDLESHQMGLEDGVGDTSPH
jgi:hypothetical protein